MHWILEKKSYFLVGFAIVIGIYFFITTNQEKENDLEAAINLEEASNIMEENVLSEYDESHAEPIPTAPVIIKVDVKGAVNTPGVYEAHDDERIIDLISKAGGFLDEADRSKVNLSKKVADEMVIYVPKTGEELPSDFESSLSGDETTASSSSSEGSQKININEADIITLQALPGIGQSKAEAIIEYRKTNGPFQKPEDLMNVPGIGQKTYEKLESAIVVK